MSRVIYLYPGEGRNQPPRPYTIAQDDYNVEDFEPVQLHKDPLTLSPRKKALVWLVGIGFCGAVWYGVINAALSFFGGK